MVDEIAVDSFLDLLGQSDLLSDDQLLALMAEFHGEGIGPENANKLADELVQRKILTAWQADMLLQGKHRGFRLGPYRILKPLGQGGMSKVFLAEHEMMRRRCAIKVLPSRYQDDTDLLSRFHLEARAIAALDHPNIVRAYDFNKDVRNGKEIHYLVMEYVEGPDLRRMVEEQGPLDYRKAADFICQAAEGLAHAHAAGFVHRDIKPANLLVDPHGVLKVLDLGLATFTFDAEQKLNSAEGGQSAVGTADYVAPEQVVDSRNVDGRADIYSLGHTFYFLLTGHRPFSKATIMEVLMAHRAEKPEPIGKFRSDVPLDLEAIIDKMTAKAPLQRYQTAKELAKKLRTWLSESGSSREYSRLSALMAEAIRAKQPSGHEITRAKSEPTENTELELATLDDEPATSPVATSVKTVGGDQTEAAQATTADAKGKNRQPVAKDGVAPGAKKQPASRAEGQSAPEEPAAGGTLPVDSLDESTLPTIQTDLLSGFLAEDLMSALPPAEPLPALAAGQVPFPYTAFSQSKKQRKQGDFLKSPWPWVGLAGLVFLVVIVVVLILVSSSSTEYPSSDPIRGDVAPIRDVPPTPSPAPKQAAPAPSPKPVEPPQTTPPLSAAAPAPQTIPKLPPTFVEKSPSPPKPEEAVPKPATGEAAIPPAPEPTPREDKVKQPEPEQPPTEKAINELLAGLKTISIPPIKSPDSDPNNPWNQGIRLQAMKAVGQVRIKVAEQASAVMEIELKAVTAEGSAGVVMSAELKCPAQDGKVVTVWKKSESIFSDDVKKNMRPDLALKGLRENVNKFFEQFQKDVRQARAKVGSK